MWEITKEFHCSYGHSVYTQRLNEDLSLDGVHACKYLHGHNAQILITLSGNELDDRGMVLDFKELGFFKKFVDDVIDHKFIMGLEDPLLYDEFPSFGTFMKLTEEKEGYLKFDMANANVILRKPRLVEKYEGAIFVPFVPTSENLAKWFFEIVQKKLEGIARVSKVEFFETPKSRSVYYGN